MKKHGWIILLIALFATIGCRQPITGETNSPPPKGGPAVSDRHPGLTPEQLEKSNKK